MDKSEAQFILQSFRPDGADARDPAFAEALALAAEDRELGEWLARERATDAAFSAALAEVEIPDALRTQILAVLSGEAGGEFSEMDAAFVDALSTVPAPAGLRDQILAAMSAGSAPESAPKRVRAWLPSAASAAAVVLGAFVAIQVTKGPGAAEVQLTSGFVEQSAIQLMTDQGFSLDHRNENPVALMSWLEKQGVPTPGALPREIRTATGIGCKVLDLNETKAALICYKLTTGEVVHLVTLNRAELACVLPPLAKASSSCHGCKKSGWASTAWEDGDKAMFLLGKVDEARLRSAF